MGKIKEKSCMNISLPNELAAIIRDVSKKPALELTL